MTIYGYADSCAENYAKIRDIPFVTIKNIIASGTTGDCTWTLDEEGTLTISGNGAMENYQYDYLKRAPWKDYEISKVVIKNGVTSIGDYAFSGCNNLSSITIPNTIKVIGNCAFENCTGLTNITIPDNVTNIGDNAFYNCSNLTEVNIPNSLMSISDNMFYNCSKLTGITIPDSITSIGCYAFRSCTSLTSITIPDSVTDIDEWAFDSCSDLTIYGYKNSCAEAYANTNNIPFVALKKIIDSGRTGECTWELDDEGTLTISGNGRMENYDSSYNGCPLTTPWQNYEVKTLIIEEGVTYIGIYAFFYCNDLTNVIIPNTITAINEDFYRCDNLKTITIPGSVTFIDSYAFDGGFLSDDFTIIGDCNSEAQRYAKEYEYNFLCDNHTIVTDEAVTATCTETGLTEGSHCSVCGEIITEQQIVPALGHQYEITPAVQPTYTKEGSTKGVRCKHCGEWLIEPTKIDKLPLNHEIGDVNFNNAIDIKDVTEIQKSLVGLTELSDEQLAAADVNGDGKVDINDVTRLQMYLAFLIDELS